MTAIEIILAVYVLILLLCLRQTLNNNAGAFSEGYQQCLSDYQMNDDGDILSDDGDEIDSLWLMGCGAEYGEDGCLYFDLKTCDYPLRVWYVGDGVWEYHSDSFGGGSVATRGELRELFSFIGEPLEKK
jgi:hypothetical protein